MHALNKTEQALLRIYEMLFICFKWFKQKLTSVHCVNNHSRLKERVLIVMGYCVYSKKKLDCDHYQIWIKLVLNVCIPDTPIL